MLEYSYIILLCEGDFIMRKLDVFESQTSGIKLPYLITTPTDFDPQQESLPLILFLHGAGERGDDCKKVGIHGIPKYFGADENRPMFITYV